MIKTCHSGKKLKSNLKREEQKYLILLSDQTVIVNSEFQAMKEARRFGKPIIEMQKTDARVNNQVTNLSILLENLEREKTNPK